MAGEKSWDIIEANETRDFVAAVKLDKEYLYRISVNPKWEKKISLHTFSAHYESVFNDKKPVFEWVLNDLKELDVSMWANTYRLKFLIFDESKLANANATDVLTDKYSENTRIWISSEVFVFPTVNWAIVSENQLVADIPNKSIPSEPEERKPLYLDDEKPEWLVCEWLKCYLLSINIAAYNTFANVPTPDISDNITDWWLPESIEKDPLLQWPTLIVKDTDCPNCDYVKSEWLADGYTIVPYSHLTENAQIELGRVWLEFPYIIYPDGRDDNLKIVWYSKETKEMLESWYINEQLVAYNNKYPLDKTA